mmetsp:Transcript_17475/g.28968  ORF Transcript_17475/g.28968 Transcript_17475/m.28968 type:complete len:125 (-) Transcript_17475:93-467(-)
MISHTRIPVQTIRNADKVTASIPKLPPASVASVTAILKGAREASTGNALVLQPNAYLCGGNIRLFLKKKPTEDWPSSVKCHLPTFPCVRLALTAYVWSYFRCKHALAALDEELSEVRDLCTRHV